MKLCTKKNTIQNQHGGPRLGRIPTCPSSHPSPHYTWPQFHEASLSFMKPASYLSLFVSGTTGCCAPHMPSIVPSLLTHCLAEGVYNSTQGGGRLLLTVTTKRGLSGTSGYDIGRGIWGWWLQRECLELPMYKIVVFFKEEECGVTECWHVMVSTAWEEISCSN